MPIRPVLKAVEAELVKGSNFTRPSPIEVALAELMLEVIPSAEMVKFAKNGSDVTAGAIRLARAYTGRDLIAMCRQDPFYSYHDWFIGTTAANAGIPQVESDLAVKFDDFDVAGLEALFKAHPGKIAAVILEPVRTATPPANYLQQVRDIAHRNGAVFILDEMITGFRWHLSGAQTYFGVEPDLCTFGKAVGNGFSVAVLAGKRKIMELGGLQHSHPRVFLLSATHGAETHALAAAIATIKEVRDRGVIDHIWKVGKLLQDGIQSIAKDTGLEDRVQVAGYPCSPIINFLDDKKQVSPPLRTLFLQETIARGVLMPYLAPSYAHKDEVVSQTLDAVRGAMQVCSEALSGGDLSARLVGDPVKPVFRKFN